MRSEVVAQERVEQCGGDALGVERLLRATLEEQVELGRFRSDPRLDEAGALEGPDVIARVEVAVVAHPCEGDRDAAVAGRAEQVRAPLDRLEPGRRSSARVEVLEVDHEHAEAGSEADAAASDPLTGVDVQDLREVRHPGRIHSAFSHTADQSPDDCVQDEEARVKKLAILCPIDHAAQMFDVDPQDCVQRWTLKWSDQPADVFPAWVAETDFSLAPPVAAALQGLVSRSDLGYPPPDERSPLRPAWVAHLRSSYGLVVDERAVRPVAGAVTGLYAAVMAFTDPGEEVVISRPAYKPFSEAPEELGRQLVDVPLHDGTRGPAGTLDLDRVADALARRPPLLLLCHPQNPTGRVVSDADLRSLQELADRAGTVVVSDEVHAPLSYRPFVPHAVATGAADRTVTLVSMSKAFNLAGTRCGVAIVGSEVEERWLRVPRRLRSGASLPGVVATLAALGDDGQAWLAALVEELRARRDQLVDGLQEVAPDAAVIVPEAGYLMWVDLAGTPLADDPAGRLLRAGLRVSPGPEFGPGHAAHVRINFATSKEGVDLILDRVADAVATAGS